VGCFEGKGEHDDLMSWIYNRACSLPGNSGDPLVESNYLIMSSYFSLKISSESLHGELEINKQESYRENLPQPNHPLPPYGHTLWSMLEAACP